MLLKALLIVSASALLSAAFVSSNPLLAQRLHLPVAHLLSPAALPSAALLRVSPAVLPVPLVQAVLLVLGWATFRVLRASETVVLASVSGSWRYRYLGVS